MLIILVCFKRLRLQEPWLLHNFDEDFYGEELRLAIVGYIRPEVIDSKTNILAATTDP
jgi:FAD synthase